MALPAYSLWHLIGYRVRLGSIGFGGPVALAGAMHRDLVETRGWITEADYREGLALAQLAPGPMAAQLAIYLGYVHYRTVGATLAGIAFVLPSFLMVVGLGWAYVRFSGLSWMRAVFYGVGPAVTGIIAISGYRLTARTIRKDRLLWAIFIVLFAVTVITETEIAWLFLLAGGVSWARIIFPGRSISAIFWLPPDQLAFSGWLGLNLDWSLLGRLALFFAKAGAFVFGSGLAIVPFLYGGVVTEHRWLNDRQFLDAVAVAMITPGPVVITVAFIGYLVAGFPGACVAAFATFVPCYLFTVLPAPYFKKYGKSPGVVAFVDGVTAAAVGAIAGSVVVIARRSLIDLPSIFLALSTLAALLKFRKLPEPVLVLLAALLGLALFPFFRT